MVYEAPKELVDKVYEAVEVAKATGKIRKGTNEATKVIEKGIAKFVAIAKDVNPPEITMHIPLLAEEKGVPCVQVPSKEELGAAAGVDVPTGSVVIVQEGEAKQLIKEIVDKINRVIGRKIIKLAGQEIGRTWKMRQEKLSPRYTTRLSEIITAIV